LIGSYILCCSTCSQKQDVKQRRAKNREVDEESEDDDDGVDFGED
jgi:hypothetical protein